MKPVSPQRAHRRRTAIVVAALVTTGFLYGALAQVPVQDQQPAGSALRPAVMGPSGGVSTGHPLTTAAAFGILLKGGNAFDAGVAALLAGGVLEQDLYSLGGEALVLVYPKKEGKVTSVVGQGWAPHAVDVNWYLSRKKNLQGEGLDPAVVPGAIHAALTVLEKWGTMSFEDVRHQRSDAPSAAFRCDEYARAIQNSWCRTLAPNKTYWRSRMAQSTSPVGDQVPAATARMLRRMVEAERTAKSRGRSAGIVAARDQFLRRHREEMVAFLRQHDAPFGERLRRVLARIESPHTTTAAKSTNTVRSEGQSCADAQHPRNYDARDGLRERRLSPHRRRGGSSLTRIAIHAMRPGVRESARRASSKHMRRSRRPDRSEESVETSWRAIRASIRR